MALTRPSSNSTCFVHAVLFKNTRICDFAMCPLLKATVDIPAKILNLRSKALLCSRSEGKDTLAHLAMICP